MNIEEMTREQLLEYIKELEKKRAFSFEDQMKLAMLDESPFTIWASDRDCKITLWEGKCEALYGFSKQQVLGRDYVDLFVAEDEKVQARIDQLSIIDNAKTFHNLANDKGRNGNILHLITNCFRIKDPNSGKFWNAEMGLVIDFFDEEKDRLQQIISESRALQSCKLQFSAITSQNKEQFESRKNSIIQAIRECASTALSMGAIEEYQNSKDNIMLSIIQVENELVTLINDFTEKIYQSVQYTECESLRQDYVSRFTLVIDKFDDVFIEAMKINNKYNSNTNEILIRRNELIKKTSRRNSLLVERSYRILQSYEKKINEYKQLGGTLQAEYFKKLTVNRDLLLKIKAESDNIADDTIEKVMSSKKLIEIQIIENNLEQKYNEIESNLDKYERELN